MVELGDMTSNPYHDYFKLLPHLQLNYDYLFDTLFVDTALIVSLTRAFLRDCINTLNNYSLDILSTEGCICYSLLFHNHLRKHAD